MISIRKVAPSEIQALVDLSVKTFVEKFASVNSESDMREYVSQNLSAQKLSAELSNPDSEFYFAICNEKPVGYLKLNFGSAQNECRGQNSLEIERIYVDQEFQGQKIGQKLFQKSLEIASAKKLDFIWLGVWEHNQDAIRFYKRNGFEIFGKHEFWLGRDLQYDLLMKLKL